MVSLDGIGCDATRGSTFVTLREGGEGEHRDGQAFGERCLATRRGPVISR